MANATYDLGRVGTCLRGNDLARSLWVPFQQRACQLIGRDLPGKVAQGNGQETPGE